MVTESRVLLNSLGKIGLTLLLAGIFFIAWLGVFVPAFRSGITVLKVLGYLTVPAVTGLGFAAGLWFFEHGLSAANTGFLRVLVWPLLGCFLGAAAIFRFGPMPIVFGVFIGGMASVLLREVLRLFDDSDVGGGDKQR